MFPLLTLCSRGVSAGAPRCEICKLKRLELQFLHQRIKSGWRRTHLNPDRSKWRMWRQISANGTSMGFGARKRNVTHQTLFCTFGALPHPKPLGHMTPNPMPAHSPTTSGQVPETNGAKWSLKPDRVTLVCLKLWMVQNVQRWNSGHPEDT